MQSINITNAQHMLSRLNGGVQFERVLHYLRLLGTVLPSIQNFGCGLALSFTQAACKQARSLRHFSGRKEYARTTEAGAASNYSI